MRRHYNVGGCYVERAGEHQWFGVAARGCRSWANYVSTNDFRHAYAQYKRLPVKHRQLDLCGVKRPCALLVGRENAGMLRTKS